jgi:hypothetical protein
MRHSFGLGQWEDRALLAWVGLEPGIGFVVGLGLAAHVAGYLLKSS